MAAVIYIRAFRVIWHKRKNLDGFFNPLNENPFINTVTREVHVTREERTDTIYRDPKTGINREGYEAYSYEVAVGKREDPKSAQPTFLQMSALSREVAQKEPNADAWLYARVAFLFFLSILITWVPSSINRVYALAVPQNVNFPLNLVSALVFPLQGFWNLLVYIITSQAACKNLWTTIQDSLPFRNRPRPTPNAPKEIPLGRLQQRRQSRRLGSDITSVTSLARDSS